MMKIFLVFGIMLSFFVADYAFASNKPEDHNQAWNQLHGQRARISDRSCLDCHTQRLECIACHEAVKPRSHNMSWTLQVHGQESRRNRGSCVTCHTEDSCVSCHQVSRPVSHSRQGWADTHCATSCQIGVRTWSRTINRNCIVCHKAAPSVNHPQPQ
jgi:hypothetical protein